MVLRVQVFIWLFTSSPFLVQYMPHNLLANPVFGFGDPKLRTPLAHDTRLELISSAEAMRAREPHGPSLVYIVLFCTLSSFTLVSSSSPWPDIADINAHAFDENLAREIVNLTEAAYCADKLVDWDCTVCQNFPGMTNVTILQGKSRNIRGFVGIDTGVDRVAVGRGDEGQGAAQLVLVPDVDSREAQEPAREENTAATAVRRSAGAMAVAAGQRRHLRARHDPTLGPAGKQPKVVITFSGTDPKSIKNWIDDLEAAPIAHAYGDECEECKVHRGFLAAYGIVQEQVGD